MVGFETADDAAVYRLTDDLAVVQSIDVLTPVVDDPYDYGRIAAANAVSDLHAMGATPRFALSFVGFPKGTLPLDILRRILEGAVSVATAENMPIVGGHTIDDKEPKFGLAVTGTIHPDHVTTNSAGRAGDLLVLTKPLGSGVVTTANKRGIATAEEVAEVVEVMASSNGPASRAMVAAGARCVTDVTGFGLLGHLYEMAAGSGLVAEIDFDRVPILESARRYGGEQGIYPGGSRRNLSYLGDHLDIGPGIRGNEALLLADAQTSGGLLIAIAPDRYDLLLAKLAEQGVSTIATIGRLRAGPGGRIEVRRG